MIPHNLKGRNLRFILLGKQGTTWAKMPIEKLYSSQNNYADDDPTLAQHVIKGHNVGVMGGFGNLVIIDYDDEIYQKSIRLPPTFTVKSGGKGLLHKYYIIDQPFKKFKVMGINDRVMMDVQCNLSSGGSAFVVCPPSIHESGRHYEIVNDIPINRITLQELKNIFNSHWREEMINLPPLKDTLTDDIKDIRDINILKVARKLGVQFKSGLMCECPIHPMSQGNNHNCKFYPGTNSFYCFHSEEGGGVIDLVMHVHDCSVAEAIMRLKNDEL